MNEENTKLETFTAIFPEDWHMDGDRDWHLDPELMTTPIADIEGEWRFVIYGGGIYYANYTTNPTYGDVVECVNQYLAETGDSHVFVEQIGLKSDEKLIQIGLGS